uniref:LysR family transcriptional regulator n=1 Tax=Phenylobacterium glaciei TaxID=2803784 RepID=A0A974P281_9CAUL|nr:LysR family transcriptional regulator [Phenylobacterium glaciei]
MTRIPSTSALRLLETAVRRRSYSHAATELNLSHSAVGQQIRRLEEDLGRRLFQRQGLSMAPTAEAQELAAAYVAARDTIERTWMRLAQGASQTTVVLSVEPAMARLWLAPGSAPCAPPFRKSRSRSRPPATWPISKATTWTWPFALAVAAGLASRLSRSWKTTCFPCAVRNWPRREAWPGPRTCWPRPAARRS